MLTYSTWIWAIPICAWLKWSLGCLKLFLLWKALKGVSQPWELKWQSGGWSVSAPSWLRELNEWLLFMPRRCSLTRQRACSTWVQTESSLKRAGEVPFPLDYTCVSCWSFPSHLTAPCASLCAATGSPSCRCGASCSSWGWTAPVRTASSSRRCVELFPEELPDSVGQGWLLLWRRRGRTEVWSTCKSLLE